MPQPAMTAKELKSILSRIDYPEHEVRFIENTYIDGKPAFKVQLRYYEADIENPKAGPVLQSARKWDISAFSTPTEVVETVYAACLRSAKHRVREHFRYREVLVMSPHFDIEARVKMAEEGCFDVREPL